MDRTNVNVDRIKEAGMTQRLTAAQTAARLGVRTETLYAYVSRGLISRERGAHGSTFDVLEVERFARSRRRSPTLPRGVARPAGSDGSPLGVIDTDITLIEDGELWFRGIPAEELVASSPEASGGFDSVVRWLFERTAWPRTDALALTSSAAVSAAIPVLDALPVEAPAFSRLLTTLAVLAAVDPERFDLRPDAVGRVTTRLIAGLVDALPTVGLDPGRDVPVAERLWARLTRLPADEERVGVLDAALILLIDHDMAVSTLSARAAASARAHPYAVVTAGLGALDSALHGAMSASVHGMLREVQEGADPAAAVAAATRRSGAGIPGFGQPLYPDGDPRASVLHSRMASMGDRNADAALRIADAVVAVVRERTGLHPTIDLMLAVMSLAWDMPPEAGEIVFAVARSAGWCAHALDEYRRAPLRLRPIGRYTGPDPADVQRAGSRASRAGSVRP
jgi:citrate synthase